MAIFQAKAFQTVGSSDFSKAKKLAKRALEVNQVDGKKTVQGYEQAISFLQDYAYSPDDNKAIEAQTLIAGYENDLGVLKGKKLAKGQSLGEFQNKEREIYFRIPQSNTSSGLQDDPYNITLRTSEIAQDLIELTSLVQEKVDDMNSKGDDASSLEDYLQKLQRRTSTMSEFYNDYVEGNFTGGSIRPDVSIYVDSNQDDGGAYNIGIMPVGDLPPGINEEDYKPLKDSAGFADGFLPVRGKGIKVNGVTTFKYGNDVWMDNKDPAGLTRKMGLGGKTESGAFQLSNAPFKGGDIKQKRFSKVISGFDDNGVAVWKTFYKDENDKLFEVDNDMLSKLSQDAGYKKDIDNASIIYDTNIAKRLSQAEGLEKLSITPITTGVEQREAERIAAPIKAEEARQEGLGFFGRLKERTARKAEEIRTTMEAKNIPNKPEEPVVGGSAPDIVEKGKEIFRQAKGFFNR